MRSLKMSESAREIDRTYVMVTVRVPLAERERLNRAAHMVGLSTNRLMCHAVEQLLRQVEEVRGSASLKRSRVLRLEEVFPGIEKEREVIPLPVVATEPRKPDPVDVFPEPVAWTPDR